MRKAIVDELMSLDARGFGRLPEPTSLEGGGARWPS
jgi:hypothetical protein